MNDPVPRGVFLFRDRDELYEPMDRRVEAMFEDGVVEEVRAAGAVSSTVSQMIGLREIRTSSRVKRESRNVSPRLSSDTALCQKTIDLVSATN